MHEGANSAGSPSRKNSRRARLSLALLNLPAGQARTAERSDAEGSGAREIQLVAVQVSGPQSQFEPSRLSPEMIPDAWDGELNVPVQSTNVPL